MDIESKLEETLSLVGTVVVQRAKELKVEGQKLARQRAFLREERRRARMDEELLRLEISDFSSMKNDEWIPAECLNPHGQRVRLNVGGQVFEVSKSVLKRDPASLLAALCDDCGPLKTDFDGIVNIDRDWWTFRYIVKFLRDGILPTDASLLTQLYREAGYWRCNSLKRAIEEQMHLYRATSAVGASPEQSRDAREWWRTPTNRWTADEKEKAALPQEADKPTEAAANTDWWTGSAYNGRNYNSPEVESGVDEEGARLATTTTWTTENEAT